MRGSITAVPRLDKILLFCPDEPPPDFDPVRISLKASAFWYLSTNTSVRKGSKSSIALIASNCAFSLAATSSAGATVITLPIFRIARPLFCIIMSMA